MRAKLINESLDYTDLFGKKVSHEEALRKNIEDKITQIVVDEFGISEKSFDLYDQAIDLVKSICIGNEEIYEEANKYYTQNKRLEYLAEKIYEEYIKIPSDINESSFSEETKDVKEKVINSRKIPKEMKEKILPLITTKESGYSQSRYKTGRVFNLKYPISTGCSLGADKNGFFVYTHRARSKSYPEIDKIPQKAIKFIKSTG